MEASTPSEQPEIKVTGPRFWAVLTFWIVAVLVMSIFSVRKAFKWAGDVNREQQKAAEEYGPPASE